MKRVIALNLKTYQESTGQHAEKLAKAADSVAGDFSRVEIILCPPVWELQHFTWLVKKATVFGQHVDANSFGAFTGSVTPEAVKQLGASGTLLNHAEKKLPQETILKTLDRCKHAGLRVLACAKDVTEGVDIAKMDPSPEMIAVEPPELIGSGISVSTAKPEVVRDAVAEIIEANKKVRVLVGAGVSNAKDVRKCFELGASGVLLASAFVKSSDPEKLLREMAQSVI
ncbi:MAG TPA: triose-phosphate isomerase [Candidatus Norongarragalinales archaeon]|jgi:triosephosphate isomerase|nr:triose-phosphate isomerase [Candidatus Norongarragalinales archaeon]